MVTIEGFGGREGNGVGWCEVGGFRASFCIRDACVLLEVEPVRIHCIVVLQFHRSSHSHLSTLSLVM
jgi:hypothetical protein